MSKLKWIVLITLLGLLVSLGVNAQGGKQGQTTQQPEEKTIRHIIFVTIDGLSGKNLESAYTPNLNGLAASGVKTAAIGVLPVNYDTFTASLLSGSDPAVHGVTNPGRAIKTKTLPEVITAYGRSATFVVAAKQVNTDLFNPVKPGKVRVINVKNKADKDVISKSIEAFAQDHPFFLGISMPGVSGLPAKNNTNKIGPHINSVDEQIGRLLSALRAQGVYDQCLIVVAGFNRDIPQAGGNKFQHNEDFMAPVIMTGPGLNSGTALPPIKITDVAPTAALLAGLQMPPETSGLVLWNALRPGTGFLQENLLLKRVKDLSEENVSSLGDAYRLTEEKRLVRAEKESLNSEKMQIQKTIENKDKQISQLKIKIWFLRSLEFATVVIMAAGYLIEYFFLKKKFLMF